MIHCCIFQGQHKACEWCNDFEKVCLDKFLSCSVICLYSPYQLVSSWMIPKDLCLKLNEGFSLTAWTGELVRACNHLWGKKDVISHELEYWCHDSKALFAFVYNFYLLVYWKRVSTVKQSQSLNMQR